MCRPLHAICKTKYPNITCFSSSAMQFQCPSYLAVHQWTSWRIIHCWGWEDCLVSNWLVVPKSADDQLCCSRTGLKQEDNSDKKPNPRQQVNRAQIVTQNLNQFLNSSSGKESVAAWKGEGWEAFQEEAGRKERK